VKIALFPLDVVLFPDMQLPLHIFEERYKEMVGACLAGEIEFGVVRAQREGLAIAGCVATVARVLSRYPDGRLDILCVGTRRFEIEQLDDSQSFLQAEVDFFEDEAQEATRDERAACVAMHVEVMTLAGIGRESYALDLDKTISFELGDELPADLGFKQRLLQSRSDRERTLMLTAFYEEMLPKLRMGSGAQSAHSNNGHGHIM
jgi:Lon protease-like protein